MKTQFDTEKEAEGALDTAKGETLCWCPVIKQDCRKDCGCYYRGDIHEPVRPQEQKGYWTVHYPCCTSPLISGEIRANVSY